MRELKFSNFQLIVYDFDGVMTDNRVLVMEDGKEAVFCKRSDGLAVSQIKKLGIPQMIISTEQNKVVRQRAKKLNIPCLTNIGNKKLALSSFCRKNKINLKKVVYIGNDINDLDAMRLVGLPVCPKDACREVKKLSKIKLNTKGGEGVIRDFFDKLK